LHRARRHRSRWFRGYHADEPSGQHRRGGQIDEKALKALIRAAVPLNTFFR